MTQQNHTTKVTQLFRLLMILHSTLRKVLFLRGKMDRPIALIGKLLKNILQNCKILTLVQLQLRHLRTTLIHPKFQT